MNNRTVSNKTSESYFHLINIISLLFVGFTLVLISALSSFAQTTTWRYVSTLPGGIKSYLNDEVKILPNKNKTRWEKMVKPDASSATALVEWNCAAKLRLTQQITFYNSDQSVVGTKKNGFGWTPIIPGSSADFLHRRVCSALTFQTAEITVAQANLRAFPDTDARIIRTAKRGDKFQIILESGQDGWFNVVDAATQEDYWLLSNSFKTIDPAAKTADNEKNKSPKTQKSNNRTKRKRRGE